MCSVSNTVSAQVPPTFTCTSIQITNTLSSSGDISTSQDLNAAGDVNVIGNINTTPASTTNLGALITNGAAVFNSSVIISSLSGATNRVLFVDPLGNLFAAPGGGLGGNPNILGSPCLPNAAPWYEGGNANPLNQSIGTCNNIDFILKSNNINRQWIKPDGKIGFGIQNPGSTAGPEYQFHAGVLRLSEMNTFGGPQVVFDGGLNPNGDWGIEYLRSNITNTPGINFWKPSGSPNSYNYLFFIGDDGRITVGAPTENTSARFNVDGWDGNGIRAKVNASTKAYIVYDKSSNAEKFIVYGNGATHIGAANAQIGFNNIAIQDAYSALNINFPNINGIRLNTQDNNIRAIHLKYADNPISVFTVFGDGRTRIGGEFNTTTPYMLTVNGKMGAREIKVSIQNPWPDYVFNTEYDLKSLESIEKYVDKHKHLPNIPSAKELNEEELSLDLAAMQGKQMEKIEEIYLHLIELNKQIKELKKENEILKQQVKK
jgi:hypothetical protein